MHETSSEARARWSAGRIRPGSVTWTPRPPRASTIRSKRVNGSDVPTARSAPKNDSCGFLICPQPPSLPTMTVIGSPKRTAISISIPFSPNALSPAIRSTRRSGWSSLAAMAKDGPTPRQPNGPGSSHWPGELTGANLEVKSDMRLASRALGDVHDLELEPVGVLEEDRVVAVPVLREIAGRVVER